jgi:hypothetical protein
LIIPNTYGLPVAFLGVPNADDPAAVVVVADVALVAPDEPPLLLVVLELLDPQAAARSPEATTAAAVPSHLERVIDFSSWLCCQGTGRSCGSRLPEVTGGEQLAPLAELGGGAIERDPTV